MNAFSSFVLTLAQIGIPPQPYYPPFGALYCAPVDANYCDEYWIEGPATLAAGQKYPLVVMFHGFNERANHVWLPGAQQFMDAAKIWNGPKPYIVVFHDGGFAMYNGSPTFNTYGAEPFHRATEAVLADVASKWPVDRDRIYGYGLSMGGGECASFAGRHQDPTKPTMLSAIIDQSGTVSITRTYTAAPGSHSFFEQIYQAQAYGTSPAVDFTYQRATALDLPFPANSPLPLDYDLKWGFHVAHNLRWVPRANFFAAVDDPMQMIEPIQSWEAFLADAGEVNAPDHVGLLSGLNLHRWDALAPSTVLQYFDARNKALALGLFSTQLPTTPGYQTELLLFSADNTRHHCFSILRADSSRWGRLHVKFYPNFPSLNAVALAINHDDVNDNVARVYIHADAHLTQMKWNDPNSPPAVVHALLTTGVGADLGTITVLGANLPQGVEEFIGGTWQGTTQGVDWTHSTGRLNLLENSSGLQRHWRVIY